MATSEMARSRRGNLKIKYVVRLTVEERETLQKMLRSEKLGAQRRQHAQILLNVDEGAAGPGWSSEKGLSHGGKVHHRLPRDFGSRAVGGQAGERTRISGRAGVSRGATYVE